MRSNGVIRMGSVPFKVTPDMLSKKMVGLFKSYTIHGFVPLLCVQAVESTLSDKKKKNKKKAFLRRQ